MMGISDGLTVDSCLCCCHEFIIFQAVFALGNIVGCAEQDDFGKEGEEYGRHFLESMTDGKDVDFALAAADNHLAQFGWCAFGQVGTAVVKHDYSLL